MRRHFTPIILIALVAGLTANWVAHDTLSRPAGAGLAGSLDLVTGTV